MSWRFSPHSWQYLGEWRDDYQPVLNGWTVQATNARGDRYVYVGPVVVRDVGTAAGLIRRIRRWEQETGRRLDPAERPRFWAPERPVYGTPAWEEQASFEEIREREDDVWAA
jgi:hypothetical protein